eukprot:GABU01005508.1.p1 GENE.GABU01005508.1~~GABU01005508.1.p1  ORF type:complete len:122 (+),score=11.08 GABU01005508.1:25-366(+)
MLYFLFSVSGPFVVEARGPGVVGDMSSFSVAPPPNLLMGKLDISLVKLLPPGEPIDANDMVALSGSTKEPAPKVSGLSSQLSIGQLAGQIRAFEGWLLVEALRLDHVAWMSML